jgi:hypothetical protein
MSRTLVIRGRYINQTFIPDGQLPDAEGPAELIIIPNDGTQTVSMFDLFGKAPRLRTKEDIAAQIQQERDEWGEP